GTLVDALAEPFDPSKYHDHYREALLELIASKTEGKQVVVPEGEQAAPVTDLVAALRASIEAAQQRKGGAAAASTRDEPRQEKTTPHNGRSTGSRARKPAKSGRSRK